MATEEGGKSDKYVFQKPVEDNLLRKEPTISNA